MSIMRNSIMRNSIMRGADAELRISTGFCRMTLSFGRNRAALAMSKNKVFIKMQTSSSGSKCF